MGSKILKWCMICFAVVFVPYVITAFISGAPISSVNKDNDIAIDNEQTTNAGSYELEQYLMMAMAANVSSDFTMETLKAQAIVIRTMVYECAEEIKSKGTNQPLTLASLGLDTMTMEEMKNSYSEKEYNTFVSNIENAIYSTKDEILSYQGKAIKAYFHYSNTGYTRESKEVLNEALSYLTSVKSTWDIEAPTAVTTSEFELNYAISVLKETYEINSVTTDNFFDQVTISSKDSQGYVKELKIGDTTITGDEFADSFSLNSSNFYFDEYNGKLRIVCKGKGNGLGMSQYGSLALEKEGKTYKQILQYYFPNAELSKLQS